MFYSITVCRIPFPSPPTAYRFMLLFASASFFTLKEARKKISNSSALLFIVDVFGRRHGLVIAGVYAVSRPPILAVFIERGGSDIVTARLRFSIAVLSSVYRRQHRRRRCWHYVSSLLFFFLSTRRVHSLALFVSTGFDLNTNERPSFAWWLHATLALGCVHCTYKYKPATGHKQKLTSFTRFFLFQFLIPLRAYRGTQQRTYVVYA